MPIKSRVSNNLDKALEKRMLPVAIIDGDAFNEGDIAVFKEDTYGKKIKNSGINVADLGVNPPVDKEISYNLDGTIDTIIDANGSKTFTYDINGRLESITGTGAYVSKDLIYDIDGKLTDVNII